MQAIYGFGKMADVFHNYVAVYAPDRESNIQLVEDQENKTNRIQEAMKENGILVVATGPQCESGVEEGDRVRLRANAHPVDFLETDNGTIIVFDEMNISMRLKQ